MQCKQFSVRICTRALSMHCVHLLSGNECPMYHTGKKHAGVDKPPTVDYSIQETVKDIGVDIDTLNDALNE